MKKYYISGSRIEVWTAAYINDPENRLYKDKKAEIVQIEPGAKEGDYMVEVMDACATDDNRSLTE